jgi:hypothetical protein
LIGFRRPLAPAVVLVYLLAVSCGDDGPEPSRVFESAPWPAEEQLEYQVRERDEILGACLLSVRTGSSDGRSVLEFRCSNPDETRRDDALVEVDSEILQPFESTVTVSDLEDGSQTLVSTNYDGLRISRLAESDNDHSEITLTIPEPPEDGPDPGYYDDTSIFWLIRGASLGEDVEEAFLDINTRTGRIIIATLRVTGEETIKVPAGSFETWRVELKTASNTNTYWVEKSGARRVIRARAERDLLELVR